MNYKTHINGGVLIGLYMTCQSPILGFFSTGMFIGSAAIGSLLPDIDHKNSYIGKRVKTVSKAINKFAGHRKLFHAPLMYLLLYSICIGVTKENIEILLVNGLFLGILSHLILDSCTVGGLPWFYPFSKKKFSFLKIKTNSRCEDITCGILTCINIVILSDLLHITSVFTFTQR